LQLVLPFLPLPNLRDEVKIVDPIAGPLPVDFPFGLPLEGDIRLVEVFLQVRPGRSRDQTDCGKSAQRKANPKSASKAHGHFLFSVTLR
jgi:hypothetical protein